MLRLGVIGFSEGNGHPYSFSAIFNGYDERKFDRDWSVILNYLQSKPSTDFLNTAKVLSIWTPDASLSQKIQKSALIEKVITDYRQMTDLDAVIIARDDWKDRKPILEYFLDAGIPVFCDKPLTCDQTELDAYRPLLESGKLYSGSGFRYGIELDAHRSAIRDAEFISCYVVNDLERYGIHMLDPIMKIKDQDITSVTKLQGRYPTYEFLFAHGHVLHLTCSQDLKATFLINLWSPDHISFSLRDNFTAFRRTLSVFVEMVKTGVNPDALVTYRSVHALCQASQL